MVAVDEVVDVDSVVVDNPALGVCSGGEAQSFTGWNEKQSATNEWRITFTKILEVFSYTRIRISQHRQLTRAQPLECRLSQQCPLQNQQRLISTNRWLDPELLDYIDLPTR
jgi:hypothetical protein